MIPSFLRGRHCTAGPEVYIGGNHKRPGDSVTVSLHTFVDLYSKALVTLDNILTKGAAFAASKGVSEADMLNWRLVDDMNPLSFQAMVVINFSKQWPARVAGVEVPESIDETLDLAGFKAEIAKAKDWLAGLTADKLAGREDVSVTFNLGMMEPTLPGQTWLTGFSTTNVYFHLSMAYAILRARGVPLGKPDMFAGGL